MKQIQMLFHVAFIYFAVASVNLIITEYNLKFKYFHSEEFKFLPKVSNDRSISIRFQFSLFNIPRDRSQSDSLPAQGVRSL